MKDNAEQTPTVQSTGGRLLTCLVYASVLVMSGCGPAPPTGESIPSADLATDQPAPDGNGAPPNAEPTNTLGDHAGPGTGRPEDPVPSTTSPTAGPDVSAPSQPSADQSVEQFAHEPPEPATPGPTAGADPTFPGGGAAGLQIPQNFASAEEATPASPGCTDNGSCTREELPEFYDADRNGDYDYVSLADFTGPVGAPDGVWDANRVFDGEAYAWWIDLDQDTFVDQVALNLSGDQEGVVDYWWVDQNEDGVPEQVLVDWGQFPPQAPRQPTLQSPGFGEVILRPNPDGSTDIIFGGVAPLPYGWEVEEYARTNPCYEHTWNTPENQVCVAY